MYRGGVDGRTSAPSAGCTRWRRLASLGVLTGFLLVLQACGSGKVAALPAVIKARSSPADAAVATFDRMTDEQRAGQLLMVGLSSSDPAVGAVNDPILVRHAGNVLLSGSGWNSSSLVLATSKRLQALATASATARVGLFIAGNQEGGALGSLQAFYGSGFRSIPSAADQGQTDATSLEAQASTWGRELAASGVNLNLAPVLDTVPPGGDATNGPIGALGRELGHDPATVAVHGAAFIRGMSVSVALAEKHFPGLGRVKGNTDFTGDDIADSEMTADDPYLQPYRAGWQAGAQMVMVSLGIYPRLDSQNPAIFSSVVINQILRQQLGFNGVVISDDLGAAAAVSSISPGERALRFLRAGGDMVITVRSSDVEPMTSAILDEMRSNPGFRAQIYASVLRILRVKQARGLLPVTA
jgi:beta-N-acetylhexosaminidase